VRENNKHIYACSETECQRLCCTKIENFGVSIGHNPIFQDVNIHIHCGELTALIGTNGAGKSTLLKAILGEVKHSGTLKYLDAKGAHSGNPVIGYVPQYLSFDLSTPTSVLDLFMVCLSNQPAWFTSSKRIRERVIKNLTRVKAEYLIDRRLGALSGGELQRVLLALALDPIPDLLLLDEPVSGIDHNGLELFYDIVSELRANYDLSIILVSHDLDLVARYADRVILLDGTVICNGTPDEVFHDEKTRKIFGMRLQQESKDSMIPSGKEGGVSC
jgi:zinc transport system ATP-binding protein